MVPSPTSLALEVLPLALGAAVSPLLLVGQVLTLTSPGSGLRRGWCFALGSALVVALWALLGLATGAALPARIPGPDPVSACLHLVLAIFLVVLGIEMLQRPDHQKAATPASVAHPLRASLLLGMGLMAANLTSLVLFLPAIQDLARSGVSPMTRALMAALVSLITLLPSLGPPLALVLAGSAGRRSLVIMSGWCECHQRQINAALCFGFSIYLAISGLLRL
ncbi:MAG: GAP family protein [Cyanobium sp. CZS 48M]|nr:GAP family protein [Cyanobium sp. CZS48M]